jgi:glycosyltransferase involved in cell wall biosynthesis
MIGISVIIPFYNRGNYIQEAVDAVLQQEPGDFQLVEIIIVDDHSDDAASIVALEKVASLDAVKVIKNTGLRGPAAARNCGIRAACGDWIGFLDSDDVWMPGALAALSAIGCHEPGCEWVGGDFSRWHGGDSISQPDGYFQGHPIAAGLLGDVDQHQPLRLRRPVRQFLAVPLTTSCSSIIQRNVLLECGGFDERLLAEEDPHLYTRIAVHHDFWFVPVLVALYRRHDANLTNTTVAPTMWLITATRLLLRDPDLRPFRRQLCRNLAGAYCQRGWYCRHQGKFSAALAAFAHSAMMAPMQVHAYRGMLGSVLRRS